MKKLQDNSKKALIESSRKKRLDARKKIVECVDLLEQEVFSRNKKSIPTGDMPSNLSAFCKNYNINRSTVTAENNTDLKERLCGIFDIIKNPPLKKGIENKYKYEIERLNIVINKLAAINHQLECDYNILRSELEYEKKVSSNIRKELHKRGGLNSIARPDS